MCFLWQRQHLSDDHHSVLIISLGLHGSDRSTGIITWEFHTIAFYASPFKLDRRQTLVSEQHSAEMRKLLKRPIPILHRDMDKACFHFRLLFPAQFKLPTLPIQSLL
ncbi:hypothetical protein T06_5288 [Trichinella sp. T6]|nr:hypothetical protein T06_5288 [Trichinella sp. T6]